MKTIKSAKKTEAPLHGRLTFLGGLGTKGHTVIVGWFACWTWKNHIRGIPNRLNYCVIFRLHV